jgi:hypothetical protein
MTMTRKRRLAAAVVAIAGGVGALLAVSAAPANADPPYAKPDLDIISCYTVDDRTDYGDGIDWFKLSFNYEGYLDMTKSFTVDAYPAWQPGVGNSTTASIVLPPPPRNVYKSAFFWVTKEVAQAGNWYVIVDSKHEVSEADEYNNFCSNFTNPT